MKRTLILFAKPPLAGRSKRRLAAKIGFPAAARFYRKMLLRIMRQAEQVPDVRLVLSIDGDPREFRRIVPCDGWRVIRQSRRNLGGRMAGAFRTVANGPATLIGSDIPDVDARDIADAFQALRHNDVVFGPAHDGGYWAIGMNRRSPGLLSFRGVRWSTPHALEDTLHLSPPGTRTGFLRRLSDIDEQDDLTPEILDRLSRKSIRPNVR